MEIITQIFERELDREPKLSYLSGEKQGNSSSKDQSKSCSTETIMKL